MTKSGKTQSGNRKAGSADARKNADFGSIGGKADMYSAPKKGTGGGGNVYHSKATVDKNKNPPSAREHESFSFKGSTKSSNEY